MDLIALALSTTVPSSAGSAGYATYCSFAGLGIDPLVANSWVFITLMVLGLNFMLAAVIYAASGIFPTTYREKARGAARYEAFQGIISAIILMIIIGSTAGLCNIGQALVHGSTTQQYQNPISFSEYYVSNLMFTQGLGLFSRIYTESVYLTLTGNIADSVEQFLSEVLSKPTLSVTFGQGLLGIFYGFSGAITSTFLALIAVTFGVLFIVYLMLPFIQQLAFTVVLPVALVMRCVPYAGPNLRQTSDTFLALAIAFYLIFPLTILLNNFIIAWIYTPCSAVNPQMLCNPYSEYNTYFVSPVPVSGIFTTNPINFVGNGFIGGTQIQSVFYGGGYAGLGGITQGLQQIFSALVTLPTIIINYGQQTAEYLFEGIFLVGMDFAITVTFAVGLSKGLSSIGTMLRVGPFWSG